MIRGMGNPVGSSLIVTAAVNDVEEWLKFKADSTLVPLLQPS
jgi:hypothetical protein